MQCLLQLRHLLSEGRYLSNNKPQHGLWISVSSCEFHSITNAEIFFGKHAFVCVLLLISAVQQLEKGLSELIWCCLSACWGYPGWAVRKARVLLWPFIVMGWILSGEIYTASPQHIQLWGRCEPWHQCGKEFSVWQAVNTRSDGLLPLMPLVLMRETVWNELLSLFPSLLSTVSAGDCPPSKNKTIGHLYKHLIMTCVYVLNLNTLQNTVRARKCVLVPSPWDLEAC